MPITMPVLFKTKKKKKKYKFTEEIRDKVKGKKTFAQREKRCSRSQRLDTSPRNNDSNKPNRK